MPDTPDGPAPAVTVTYCVPAVEEALFGPLSVTVGCWLSTSIVLVAPVISPAASQALIFS